MSHPRLQFLGLSAILIGACGQAPQAPSEPETPPNVIIVMVDTLRADHMSLYGYDRGTTPFIDRFASEAVVFERARSQAACTFPSVNSLFTSRYPFVFTRQGKGQMGIPYQYPTIAEILKRNGYQTIAVSASAIVRKSPSAHNPNGGFGRGFDVFDEKCVWGEGGCVNRRALKLLDSVEEPFFLYLHYMEPHAYYAPPPHYTRRFAEEYDGHDFIRDGDPNPIGKMIYGDGPKVDISNRDIQHLIDLYDDEIRYFDGVFQRLVTRLDRQGLLENSLIVFVSDHGEEFLEHGHIAHCRGIWDTVTRVPLFIRIPGIEGGRRIDSAVQNLDIVPTLLDYLSIESTDLGFEGTSLRTLVDGRESTSRYAFADQGKYRSVDDGRLHLILDGQKRTATLFDAVIDPLEQHDLYTPGHPDGERMTAKLNQWLEEIGQGVRFDEALAAAKAKEEELRALGYLR